MSRTGVLSPQQSFALGSACNRERTHDADRFNELHHRHERFTVHIGFTALRGVVWASWRGVRLLYLGDTEDKEL